MPLASGALEVYKKSGWSEGKQRVYGYGLKRIEFRDNAGEILGVHARVIVGNVTYDDIEVVTPVIALEKDIHSLRCFIYNPW
ncbi:hypothetical protein Tco_1216133 [Tanacetum coccineum]